MYEIDRCTICKTKILLVAYSTEETSSTCDILDHNRHKIVADPKINVINFASFFAKLKEFTSLSEVPQTEQHLHSMHCQRYFFTDILILAVNCRQVGCPIKFKDKLKIIVLLLFSNHLPRND